jgi:hypothetical protein
MTVILIFMVCVDVQVLIHWSVLQVVKDERLRQAIEAAAQHDYSKTGEEDDEVYKGILQGHEARATKILYDMRSTLSDFLLRYSRSFFLWHCNHTLYLILLVHSVEVHTYRWLTLLFICVCCKLLMVSICF